MLRNTFSFNNHTLVISKEIISLENKILSKIHAEIVKQLNHQQNSNLTLENYM